MLQWTEVTRALAARCASSRAAAAAEALRPDLDEESARTSLAETDEAVLLLEDGGLPVGGVRDVEAAVDLAARGGILEPASLADVARTLEAVDELARVVARDERAPLLAGIASRIVPQPALVRAIDAAVDERGRLRDDASPLLVELTRRKVSAAHRVEQRLESLRRDPEVAAALTDDFVTLREDRLVLPVRVDRRAKVPGILHGRSGSGQSVFIEPAEIVELNNELRSIAIDVDEEIARILRDLSLAVGRASGALRDALDAHRALDLASARARFAALVEGIAPEIDAGGGLDLRDLAHPLLLLMRAGAAPGEPGRGSVVRNDVSLSGSRRGIVISGPNTGGKTVLLEAVGLACLLVRAGLHVPCAPGSRVPFLDAVLADIGDEQSLERSLSSFSGHVARISEILDACAESKGNALVLVDEIMLGTDPAEGGPLAEALLEEMARLGVLVIVTTHLGRLKSFASEHPAFGNAGMEFDAATLRPTYRMRPDVPGASAALSVAERLGLEPRVVERAKELAGAAQVTVEALLRDLETARIETERARDEAARIRFEAERTRAELERRLAQVESKDAAFVRTERAAFERELSRLREEAAGITKRLQQQPSLPAAAEAIRRLEDLKQRARGPADDGEAADATSASTGSFARGARVRSLSLEKDGVVVDPADGRGRVRVAFGTLSMQVDASDLVAKGAAGTPARPQQRPRREAPAVAPSSLDSDAPNVPFTPQSPRNTCDLRGMRVDEALARVSRFLEEARSGGERQVILIHGHGTGAVRNAVRSELKHESRVLAFRPGERGEGGDGVTVATLS